MLKKLVKWHAAKIDAEIIILTIGFSEESKLSIITHLNRYSSLNATQKHKGIDKLNSSDHEKLKVTLGFNKLKKFEKHNINTGMNKIIFKRLYCLSLNFKGLFFKTSLNKKNITN